MLLQPLLDKLVQLRLPAFREGLQQQLAKAKVKHQPVENGECASCHAPHQSDNKKLLSKPEGKLCFDCHDDLQQEIAKLNHAVQITAV